ncbi:MAG TPA: nucleoside/nucleotide kinase family protein [Janthinobacterium sp.]|nr:nucleoside/nucleotide kinase family protein [Janthinobacterium sp.]
MPHPANHASTAPAIALQHLRRVEELLRPGGRVILGIVGAPGAGKSTFAQALQLAFPQLSQVVPMDGFHLANSELARLGRAGRKGAPDTFDDAGYCALLRRLRAQGPSEVVYAPEYRRDIEEGVAGAIAIHPHTRLIITEGNYLLLDEGHWPAAAALLDQAWFLDVDQDLRTSRLLRRHQRFGRTPQAALDWVAGTDEPNARLIAATRVRAGLVVGWNEE